MEADVSETIGRYIIQKKLGEGAMGRVFLALDPVLQRNLALKIIALDRISDEKNREEYLHRFITEARASAKLSHPSVVTVYDAGRHDGLPWIAFEFVEGSALEALMKREGRLPVERAVSIARDIAAGLHHAHDCGIVHRDVKPANILLDARTGIAKLSDFGVVKAPWTALTQEGMAVGSPGYMSPEQIEGKNVDARSDIFSLGVVLYEMLTGVHPFIRDTLPATAYATVNASCTPLRDLLPSLPAHVESTVAAALCADKEKRIRSAREFLDRLSRPTAGTGASNGDNRPKSHDFSIRAIGDLWKGLLRAAVTGIPAARIKLSSVWRSIRAGRRIAPLARKHGKISLAILLTATILATIVLFRAIGPRDTGGSGLHIKDMISRKMPEELDRMVRECGNLIREKEYQRANSHAKRIAESWPAWAIARILSGRIALATGDYAGATREFEAAARMKDGASALLRERGVILEDLQPVVEARAAPRELIDILAVNLSAAEDSTVRRWTGDTRYWLRWNAVNVIKAGNKDVDMVTVYLLDLKHGGSIRTRMRAAEKLGELGDERAVEALRESASRGWRDPFVSAKAKTVLERDFGERQQP